MLLNALTDIYRGHLDTHLVPASQLIEQLNIISGKLPLGLSLPINNVQEDIQDIYELIYVKARITKYHLLFELHIPLFSDEEYTIYKILPIPFTRQGRLKLVQASLNYIAINFVKNTYIKINERDMHQCTKYREDKFSCVANQPVYSLHDKKAPCEVKVFSEQQSLSCIINDVQCKDTWEKLHKPNLWLFTLCDNYLMRVICDTQVTPVAINGTGIMELQPKCLLQKKDATIFTYSTLGSSVQNLRTNIDVPTIDSPINNMFDLSWKNARLNITEKKTSTSEDIAKIERQLTYQEEKEKLPVKSDISVHDIIHYVISTLLLGGISLTVVYIILKKRRTKEAIEGIRMKEIKSSIPGESIDSAPKPKSRTFNFDELTV